MSYDKLSKHYIHLNEREISSFKEWQDSNEPELPPGTIARFYGLFLNGNDCSDIVRLNPGVTLGQVVHARLSGEWDDRKEKYLNELLVKTEKRHLQVSMETIAFISDLLAVNVDRYNAKIKKYWSSQNEADLGDMAISLKQIKEMAELHQKLAGTNNHKTQVVKGQVDHVHKVETPDPSLKSEAAGEQIRSLLKGKA